MSVPALMLLIASQIINVYIGKVISEPEGGCSSTFQTMLTFLNEKCSMKQEIEAIKNNMDEMQTKMSKLEDDIKDQATYRYIPGPRMDITKDFKTVTQSSKYDAKFPAQNAIDGSLSTFSHTNAEAKPWWSMEFFNDVTITAVRLRNRFDCCDYQMANIIVTVGNEVCGRIVRPIGIGGSVEVTCPKPLVGKILTIQRTDTAFLSIAELQVFSPSSA